MMAVSFNLHTLSVDSPSVITSPTYRPLLISSRSFGYFSLDLSKCCWNVPPNKNGYCTRPNNARVNLNTSTCDACLPLIHGSRSLNRMRTCRNACFRQFLTSTSRVRFLCFSSWNPYYFIHLQPNFKRYSFRTPPPPRSGKQGLILNLPKIISSLWWIGQEAQSKLMKTGHRMFHRITRCQYIEENYRNCIIKALDGVVCFDESKMGWVNPPDHSGKCLRCSWSSKSEFIKNCIRKCNYISLK